MRVFTLARVIKMKLLYGIIAITPVIYLFLSKLYNVEQKTVLHPVDVNYVVVHIDLKGAPPKLSFLTTMLVELKALGANALLMEYEDMFPYNNNLVNLSTPKHYKRNELKLFLKKANSLKMEIIPLVQTFGHMEWVLKLDEFKSLRELKSSANSICPSNSGSIQLIRDMLNQVIDFHNSVVKLKHFHIGCDEVKLNTLCKACMRRSLESYQIFMNHVDTVSNIVWKKNPNTTILVWDDMLRFMKKTKWKHFRKRSQIEIVFWDYHNFEKKNLYIPMFFYHKYFQNVWGASAFKGADGKDNAIPNYEKRTKNILNWMTFIKGYVFGSGNKVHAFKGIILTGWSRYTHFDPLCELLPVSYQSLISSLILVNKFRMGVQPDHIDWNGDSNLIFERYFLRDYYSQIKCKSDGPSGKIINTCILNSTTPIFDNVQQIDMFMEVTKRERNKTKHWCHKKRQLLVNLINRLKWNMKLFYRQDVRNEYVNDKLSLGNQLATCDTYHV